MGSLYYFVNHTRKAITVTDMYDICNSLKRLFQNGWTMNDSIDILDNLHIEDFVKNMEYINMGYISQYTYS